LSGKKQPFMKKLFSLCFIAFLFTTQLIKAQAPQAFTYQAVARDAAGLILSNQAVTLRFSILQNSSTGVNLYSEIHNVTTSNLGLCNLNIGQGTPVSGNFANIDWGNGPKYFQVEIDPAGGNAFILMGTTQLLSVPYALFAGNSSAGGGLPNGSNTGNTTFWNGTEWVVNSSLLYNNGT